MLAELVTRRPSLDSTTRDKIKSYTIGGVKLARIVWHEWLSKAGTGKVVAGFQCTGAVYRLHWVSASANTTEGSRVSRRREVMQDAR
jgi:hypothetical protein